MIGKAESLKSLKENNVRIVIYVDGGVVQGVLADTTGIEAMIVDYDNERAGQGKAERSFEPVDVDLECIEKTSQGIEG